MIFCRVLVIQVLNLGLLGKFERVGVGGGKVNHRGIGGSPNPVDELRIREYGTYLGGTL